ncbi:MAG: LiaI-LiaF-like domain-containing protein, partial [Anaerolineales bacterium]
MSANRRNLLWPLLVIVIGVLALLSALDVIPQSLIDVIERSWGILLVIAGLNMLLIDRVRFGNWLALGLSVPILGAIVYFAFLSQADTFRDDYREALPPLQLGEHITTLFVSVDMLDTQIDVQPADQQVIRAEFLGSAESWVRMAAEEDPSGTVNLSILEERGNQFPALDAIGRGRLEMALPAGITIDNLDLETQAGDVSLNFAALDVPRLDIRSQQGDITLRMPQQGIVFADIQVAEGNLRLIVDPTIPLDMRNIPSTVDADPN